MTTVYVLSVSRGYMRNVGEDWLFVNSNTMLGIFRNKDSAIKEMNGFMNQAISEQRIIPDSIVRDDTTYPTKYLMYGENANGLTTLYSVSTELLIED